MVWRRDESDAASTLDSTSTIYKFYHTCFLSHQTTHYSFTRLRRHRVGGHSIASIYALLLITNTRPTVARSIVSNYSAQLYNLPFIQTT